MGLFKKKQKEEEKTGISKIPELPRLPELPVFSSFNSSQLPELEEPPKNSKQLAQLPSFPTSSFGRKFSQSTIKDAVTGQEEGEEVNYNEEEEIPMIPTPLKKRVVETYDPEKKEYDFARQSYEQEGEKSYEQKKYFEPKAATREEEPIFIRMDKFEENLKVLEQTKKQIRELENLLKETKELKQKESQELSSWESELQQLKLRIEKVDKDIFSKVK
jgi:hypothetical protein